MNCLNLQLNAQRASLNEHLQPLLEHSAALASAGVGKSAGKGDEGKDSAAAARRRVLHTLGHAGQLLWPHLAPGVALEASQQLVEHVASVVLGDVLHRKVRGLAINFEQPVLLVLCQCMCCYNLHSGGGCSCSQ